MEEELLERDKRGGRSASARPYENLTDTPNDITALRQDDQITSQ